jgi:hypothetical protein
MKTATPAVAVFVWVMLESKTQLQELLRLRTGPAVYGAPNRFRYSVDVRKALTISALL